MKARIVTFLGLIVLLAGAFTFQREASTKYVRSSLQPLNKSLGVMEVVPDSVVYGFLFTKVVSTKDRTSALQAQGRLGPTAVVIRMRPDAVGLPSCLLRTSVRRGI